MVGDGVIDEILGRVEGARTARDGAVYSGHVVDVWAPTQAPDRNAGRGERLDGSGLVSGPLPRVACAPSAGGTPA